MSTPSVWSSAPSDIAALTRVLLMALLVLSLGSLYTSRAWSNLRDPGRLVSTDEILEIVSAAETQQRIDVLETFVYLGTAVAFLVWFYGSSPI